MERQHRLAKGQPADARHRHGLGLLRLVAGVGPAHRHHRRRRLAPGLGRASLSDVTGAGQPAAVDGDAARGHGAGHDGLGERCRHQAAEDLPPGAVDLHHDHQLRIVDRVDGREAGDVAALARLHPADELFLLLGADVLDSFGQWREPQRILELARVVLLAREPNDRASTPPAELAGANVTRLPTRRIDVSSTEIRDRVRLGKPIRGYVTDDVAAYIARDGLYR